MSLAFLRKKLLIKNIREGAKNGVFTKSKGPCVQNSELISKSKHYRYLEASLLSTYIKYTIARKNYVVEFLPKRQTQVCTKLGPKTLRNGVRDGA